MRWLFLAVLSVIPGSAWAASTMAGAANDLAQEVASAAGQDNASVTYRNLSSMELSAFETARSAVESALRGSGVRIGESPAVWDIRITFSADASRYLAAAEMSRGEERRVSLAFWPRAETVHPAGPALILQKKQLWEQEDPILDVAPSGERLLVLAAARIIRVDGAPTQSMPLSPLPTAPREPRGRLVAAGNAYRAYLPGALCQGSINPLTVECRAGDDPWPLDSGGQMLGLAFFAAGRNYFSGRIVTAPGGPHAVPAFFSAAQVQGSAGPLWILAGTDARTHLYSHEFEPAGTVDSWGGILAGLGSSCAGQVVLATRPTESAEPDAVTPFRVDTRGASPAGPALEFAGPVLALWSSGPTAASAVVYDRITGKYEAYGLYLACGG